MILIAILHLKKMHLDTPFGISWKTKMTKSIKITYLTRVIRLGPIFKEEVIKKRKTRCLIRIKLKTGRILSENHANQKEKRKNYLITRF